MCQYFSCIVTKDLKVHWLPSNPCDHEALLSKLRLEDTKLQFRDFVRIEIAPKDTNKVTRNIKDWQLRVDELATLPEWFVEKQKEAEKNCFVALKESMQINIALGDEDKGEVKDTYLVLWGNSRAVLWGNSRAELRGNSRAELRENSSAELWGNSRAELRGNSRAVLRENSSAVLRENSSAVLRENSSAELQSTTSVAIKNGEIHVHAQAKVVVEKAE